MIKTYALIRILSATMRFDKEYAYFVLSEMRDSVKIGSVCTVPYGNSNRLRTGIVVGFSENCDYPQVKPIAEVFDYPVTLNEEGIGLCNFIKDRFFCTFGAAAKTVMPSGQEIETVFSYETSAYDKKQLNDKAEVLYDWLYANGKTTESKIVSEFGDDSVILLKALAKLGAVKVTSEARSRINEKKSVSYRLASTDEALFAVENPETLRSAKQMQLVDFLKDGGIITVREAEELFGIGQSTFTTLTKSKIIEKFEKRDERYYLSPSENIEYTEPTLTENQQEAFNSISSLLDTNEPKAALLYGVTGSGKTRVIIEACKKVIEKGKQAIVLVPEIGLTAQAVNVYRSVFGNRLAVLHSMLSVGERLDTCRRMQNGDVDLVIGTRSAVFAPFRRLGMIAIDEEQEHTYKSENTPKYHARDIARYRCAYNKCLLLLASATPSVESFYKAETGVYSLIRLDSRYGRGGMPECKTVDIRGDSRIEEGKIISSELKEQIERVAENGGRSILFVNRRGYNSHLSCVKCGYVFTCPNCSVSMTYHAYGDSGKRNKLVCHYCGYVLSKPDKCPSCGEKHINSVGYGTQKLQEELERDFPSYDCVRMDADTTSDKHSHEEIISDFAKGRYNILFGTQMISKGLDFPKVGLVGVLSADSSLYMNDFRAGERAFSLFTQLAGRSGRGDEKGKALFQTYNPDNEILKLSLTQDYQRFYRSEIVLRKAVLFPPFCDVAVFTFSAETESDANSAAEAMSGVISRVYTDRYSSLPMIKLGPYKEGVFKLRNKYRQRVIIKYQDKAASRMFLADAYGEILKLVSKTVHADIDINPPVI